MINHNISPLSNCRIKVKGVVIRKWDINENNSYTSPQNHNLKKQMLTLHKKLKKKDRIYTEYSIEKDNNRNSNHIHLMIHYSDEQNLYNTLQKFIGGDKWSKKVEGLNIYDSCGSKYGYIDIDSTDIVDIKKYRDYINKINPSTSLI